MVLVMGEWVEGRDVEDFEESWGVNEYNDGIWMVWVLRIF